MREQNACLTGPPEESFYSSYVFTVVSTVVVMWHEHCFAALYLFMNLDFFDLHEAESNKYLQENC